MEADEQTMLERMHGTSLADDSERKERASKRREAHFSWLRQQKDVFSVRSFPDKLAVLEALTADVENYTRNEREERYKEREAVLEDLAGLRKDGILSEEAALRVEEELEENWNELDSVGQQYERTLRHVSLMCREMQTGAVQRGIRRLLQFMVKEREKMAGVLRDLPCDKEALQELLHADDKRITEMVAREEEKAKVEKDLPALSVVKESLKEAADELSVGWPRLQEDHELYRLELEKAFRDNKEQGWRKWQADRDVLLDWMNDQIKCCTLAEDRPLPNDPRMLEQLASELEAQAATQHRHQLDLDEVLARLHVLTKSGTVSQEDSSAEEEALLKRWQELATVRQRYTDALLQLQAKAEQELKLSEESLAQVDELSTWCREKQQTFHNGRQAFPQYLSALEELTDCLDRDYTLKEYRQWQHIKADLEGQLTAKAKLSDSARSLLDRITADWQALKDEEEAYRAALDAAIEARQTEVVDEAETNQLLSWVWQRQAEVSQQRSDMLDFDIPTLLNKVEQTKRSLHNDQAMDIMKRKEVLEERLGSRASTLSRACAENLRSAFLSLETATNVYVNTLQAQIKQKELEGKGTGERVAALLQWVQAKREWLTKTDVTKMDHHELEQLATDLHDFQQKEWVEQRQEKRMLLALLLPKEELNRALLSPSNEKVPDYDNGSSTSLAGQLQAAWSLIRQEMTKFAQELKAALASSANKAEESSKEERVGSQPANVLAMATMDVQPQTMTSPAPVVNDSPATPLGSILCKDQGNKVKGESVVETDLAYPLMAVSPVTAVETEASLMSAPPSSHPTTIDSHSAVTVSATNLQTSLRGDNQDVTEDSSQHSDSSSVGSVVVEVDAPIGSRLSCRGRMHLYMEHQAELLAWIRRQVALFQQRDFPSALPSLEQLRLKVGTFERGAMATKLNEKNTVLEDGQVFADEEGDESDDAKTVVSSNKELIAMWEWLEKEILAYKEALRNALQQKVVPTPPHSPNPDDSYTKMVIRTHSRQKSALSQWPPKTPQDTTIKNVTIQDLICSLWWNYREMIVPF